MLAVRICASEDCQTMTVGDPKDRGRAADAIEDAKAAVQCTTHHRACPCRESVMQDLHYATWRAIDRAICGTITFGMALHQIQTALKEYEKAIGYDEDAP